MIAAPQVLGVEDLEFSELDGTIADETGLNPPNQALTYNESSIK